MIERLADIISVCINTIFEAFYICCWVLFIEYILQPKLYKANVYPLKKEINEINVKQTILYKATKKLKFIIDYDYKTIEDQIKILKKDLELLKQNQEKEQIIPYNNDIISASCVETNEETNEDTKYNTHITFPHYRIYDKSMRINVDKKTQIFRLKCLSHQLTEFMSYTEGRCLRTDEVISFIETYFDNHSETGLLKVSTKVRKLFNISEDTEPKITLPKFLRLIEPHLI